MRDHTSPSQIVTWFTCPLRWWFRDQGFKIIPSAYLHVGSGTHKGVEKNLQNKIETGEPLPLEAVQDITRDETNRSIEEKGLNLESDQEKEKGDKKVRGEAVDQAVKLVSHHHAELAPEINPVAVEEEWRLNVRGYPVYIKGFVDIRESGNVIRETKTSGQTPPGMKPDHLLQVSAYGMWHWKEFGDLPLAWVDYLIKNKVAIHKSCDVQLSVEHFKRFLGYLEVMEEALEKGIFQPTLLGPYPHSPKMCGYWNLCFYGAGDKRP